MRRRTSLTWRWLSCRTWRDCPRPRPRSTASSASTCWWGRRQRRGWPTAPGTGPTTGGQTIRAHEGGGSPTAGEQPITALGAGRRGTSLQVDNDELRSSDGATGGHWPITELRPFCGWVASLVVGSQSYVTKLRQNVPENVKIAFPK